MERNESKGTDAVFSESVPACTSKSERQWAMGCHLIGLCGVFVPIPSAGLIGTLVFWLIKREDGTFIDEQGKEALNFQISLLIYAAVCIALTLAAGIGLLLLFPLGIFGFISIIVAGIKASEGIAFRYFGCIHFIK